MEAIFEKLYFSFTGQKLAAQNDFAPTEQQIRMAGSIFGTLQRQEEYEPTRLDDKGRFPAEQSALFAAGKHQTPLVDEYFDSLFPGAYNTQFTYQCIPTFDIDNAYAFRGKGFVKNAGGMAKNLFTDPKRAGARWQTWTSKQPDPYDTYAYIIKTCRSFGLKPLFFIQMGNYNNGYDTNINFRNPEARELLNYLAQHGDIGLHPSYASNADYELLQREYEHLCNMIGRSVTKSRQHFLMLRFPDTYRRLLKLGIKEEYSMGWPSQPGFRAGTTRPFLWYDWEQHEFTDLTVYPFAAMDGTLHEYARLSTDEALATVEKLVAETRRHQGIYVPLWHNHSVNNRWEWAGWQPLFEQMLALACP